MRFIPSKHVSQITRSLVNECFVDNEENVKDDSFLDWGPMQINFGLDHLLIFLGSYNQLVCSVMHVLEFVYEYVLGIL